MAFSLISFAAILLVSSSAIYPSSGIPEEILKNICSVGHSGTSCRSILKSDPRTASSDLPQLSLISIELPMKHADSNIKSFTEIAATNSTDPQITKRCSPCVGIVGMHDSSLCSVNSIALDQLSQNMISRCETCQSVNKYMVSQPA
ncbi:hypothetical protein Ddye_027747 [Dipteronia dyeriana]|uniref:Uncharacterized protein n=1 Tax=Dipteronia dyeriana TaxID=168575 RepID=A0AAD9TPR7_9ROSI|nr:hypothetical protein Ddye_027747 [Dipteronia dyeriana]